MVCASESFEYCCNLFWLGYSYDMNKLCGIVWMEMVHFPSGIIVDRIRGFSLRTENVSSVIENMVTDAMREAGFDISEIDVCLPRVQSEFKKMMNICYGSGRQRHD